MKWPFFNVKGMLISFTALGMLVGCSLEKGEVNSFTPSIPSEVPEEITATVSHQFVGEPEATQMLNDLNSDMDRMFPNRTEIQSWVFSYAGTVDQAVHLLNKPEDAEAGTPYTVPITGILNYHLFMAGDRIEAVRGTDWVSDAHTKAWEWEDLNQRIGEVYYTREAYPGAKDTAAIDEDPYLTWCFSVVSPLIDMRSLDLVEGTYIVASRIQVLYPPNLE